MTTTALCPGKFPVAINGRPYMVDPAGFRRESLPILRQQSDTSDLPSEASLNPRALWRRSAESWHHGAGQTLFDGKSSGTAADPERFFTSHNIDVWTRGQISLMPETVMVAPPSGGGTPITPAMYMVAAANHLYIAETTNLYWASNPTTTTTTWTSSVINAGEGAQNVTSLATDGYYVWAALGTSGLHRTVRGASSSTANVPAAPAGGNIGLVGYALGRLLVAGSATSTTQRNVLWEVLPTIVAPALSPAAAPYLMTHANTGFVWTGITPGRNCIYVFGNTPGDVLNLSYGVDQGGTGEVYKVSLSATDTALTTPSPATYLPDGESIHDVRFYAGGVILATSRGLRLGQADGAGNIDYGPLVVTTKPVLALEPQDRYVWFTGSNEGLHRADLGYFTDPLTPAWAPDAVITDTSATQALVKAAVSLTSSPNPVFLYHGAVVSGSDPSGVYRPSGSVLKPIGYVETGQLRFGTTESKTIRAAEIRHSAIPAGARVYLDVKYDDGVWQTIVTNTTAGTTKTVISTLNQSFEVLQMRLYLWRSTATTSGPTVYRWTIKVLPTPARSEAFTLPLLLHSSVVDLNEAEVDVNVPTEITALKALETAGTIVEFQVGADTFTGFLEESQHQGDHWSKTGNPHRFIEGTYTVRMVTV
jgi:hypothetical protein